MKTEIQTKLIELVKAIEQFQNDNLPKGCHMHIDLNDASGGSVYIHGCENHSTGLEVKRSLGIENAEKNIYDSENPWHTMTGKLFGDYWVHLMCRGLPPMCRVETYEEEIPKEQVVTLAETVRVKRTRICCGEAK